MDAFGKLINSALKPFSGTYRLFNPQSTTAYKYVVGQVGYVDNSDTIIGATVTGIYRSTTAVTGVQFIPETGTITSGTIRIYGVAK